MAALWAREEEKSKKAKWSGKGQTLESLSTNETEMSRSNSMWSSKANGMIDSFYTSARPSQHSEAGRLETEYNGDEPCPSEDSDENDHTDTEETRTDLNSERAKLVG